MEKSSKDHDSLQEYIQELQETKQLPFSANEVNLLSKKGQHNVYEAVDFGNNNRYIIRIPKTISSKITDKPAEHITKS